VEGRFRGLQPRPSSSSPTYIFAYDKPATAWTAVGRGQALRFAVRIFSGPSFVNQWGTRHHSARPEAQTGNKRQVQHSIPWRASRWRQGASRADRPRRRPRPLRRMRKAGDRPFPWHWDAGKSRTRSEVAGREFPALAGEGEGKLRHQPRRVRIGPWDFRSGRHGSLKITPSLPTALRCAAALLSIFGQSGRRRRALAEACTRAETPLIKHDYSPVSRDRPMVPKQARTC